MRRLMHGLGALTVLLLLLVGVPVLLSRLGSGLGLQTFSVEALRRLLLRPDDGSVLLGLITGVAWLAWAVFAASVLAEVLAVATRYRVRVRLPGLGGPQRVAAGLVLAVLALAAAPAVPHVGPPPTAARAAPAVPGPPPAQAFPPAAEPVEEPGQAVPSARADDPSAVVHEVRPGDDLWSLAERYYGSGPEWRRIAAANPDRLTGGPDRLEVGWRLRVPGVRDSTASGPGVMVRAGDTLSGIAGRALGDSERWPELYRANRAVLADPDVLEPGTRLVVPGLRPGAAAADDRSPETETAVERAKPDPAPPVRPAPPLDDGVPLPSRSTEAPPTTDQTTPEPAVVEDVLPFPAVGGLLAAGVLGGLALRRQRQLATRPVGRRIPHPAPEAAPLEAALGRRQRPLTLRTLDRALRTVAASCRNERMELPPLQLVLLSPDQIELRLAAPAPLAPVGFQAEGARWLLDRTGADYLTAVPATDEVLRPWPTLVTLGQTGPDRPVLADLEALRLLQLEAPEREHARAVLTALAVELSFSPWAEEMRLTLLGPDGRLPTSLGSHGVEQTDDPEALLARLERRAADQRRHQPHAVLGQHRLDPDLAEPWTPEVVLVDRPLTAEQAARLRAVVCEHPHVTTAAVVIGDIGATWRLRLEDGPDAALLEPVGLRLAAQQLSVPETDGLLELVAATGRTATTLAPWWHSEVAGPEPPPDNVAYLGRRFGGWAADTAGEGDEVMAIQAAEALTGGAPVAHPTLRLLGPVDLLGAAGVAPPRAEKQCLEYCGWLLEHPGQTARAMASALAVAEGTRRSNMSRLRSWLGTDEAGESYLPDAYTGRISLSPAVSSDWQRLQILTAGGVNRASTDALRAALQLVRGAPLADAAPGQWHWAEELRTDLISCVRDVGVELARRALDDGDLALARWAAARALVAAPGDELLLAARIRTEHLAGNANETERLTLQLAAQARRLGVDLDPQTVALLQEVVEGRVRAQLA
nr:LysM peptidoglycan-binding domain-containing protein [uncultured Friedmanniella sp.]